MRTLALFGRIACRLGMHSRINWRVHTVGLHDLVWWVECRRCGIREWIIDPRDSLRKTIIRRNALPQARTVSSKRADADDR